MVEIFLSTKHENIFHVRYSGLVTLEDDQSYWDLHLKNFMFEKKDIRFVTEIVKDCIVVDKSFFDVSDMDKLDPWKHLKYMDYITENGIHKGFMNKYINEFPCDYVEHEIFATLNDYCKSRKIFFSDFECVFSYTSKNN